MQISHYSILYFFKEKKKKAVFDLFVIFYCNNKVRDKIKNL